MSNCKNPLVSGYLSRALNDDERLEFLLHVDECPSCWDKIYLATRDQHPHYYKATPRKNSSQRKTSQVTQSDKPLFEVA